MKIYHYVLGMIASIAMVIVLLITAFEIAAYSNYGWYEKEYIKYEVLDELGMELEDVMEVTREMMSYLRGDRENLVVETTVHGFDREFFNDREKAHMVDVQELFLRGITIRRIALGIFALMIFLLIVTKARWKKTLAKSFLITVSGFVLLLGIFAVLLVGDFNKYFLLFHELVFDNKLWILDPWTDLLIRMLPEGFFYDMVLRIGCIFTLLLLLTTAICLFVLRKRTDKKNL